MNNLIKPVIIIAAIGIAIYLLMQSQQETESVAGEAGCIIPDRDKFKVSWGRTEETKENGKKVGVPIGLSKEIAVKYFPDMDANVTGSAVSGFFKAIDLFPHRDAARFYQKAMENWVNSPKGISHWSVRKGELLCDASAVDLGSTEGLENQNFGWTYTPPEASF